MAARRREYAAGPAAPGPQGEPSWNVEGGARPYRVTEGRGGWRCSCEAWRYGYGKPCRHIRFVRGQPMPEDEKGQGQGGEGAKERKARPPRASALDEAVLCVMQEVPYVQKTGKVGSGSYGYTFAGEADFIERLHPALVKHGLTLQPVGAEVLFHEQYQTGKGAAMNRVAVRMAYRLTHAPSGQSRDLAALGEGTDAGDKAIPKAQTIALKYVLRQMFVVETGNDPDEHPAEAAARAPQPARQEPPPAPPRPAPPWQRPAPAANGTADRQAPAPAPAPANGQARQAPPWQRLRAIDAQLAGEGRIDAGVLLQEAREALCRVLGDDPEAWPDDEATRRTVREWYGEWQELLKQSEGRA